MISVNVLPSATSQILNVEGGRVYVPTPGTPIVMPDADALIAGANGWIVGNRVGGVGTTAQRPTIGLYVGYPFDDTTVGYAIKWDGATWRNPLTGASV